MSTPTLLTHAFQPGTVLLTGAGGYLGALIGGALLARTTALVVVPLRQAARATEVVDALCDEAKAYGLETASQALKERIRCIDWPEVSDMDSADLQQRMRRAGVTDVVHCAGCLDYYDEAALQSVNVDYTAHLAAAAQALEVRRFIYVSTAYSAGYLTAGPGRSAVVPERISAEEPPRDPTSYTRSKRNAERAVAAYSGLPWLILRPSIVIGAARDGRYSGKRYGLYQQWMGLERLLGSKYHAEIHTVAPMQPLNLLHQDVFQDAFLAALHYTPPHSVVHLTSRDAACPSMRVLWQLWMEHVSRPQRVVYYEHFDDIDLKAIDTRQRAYLTFAQVNLEIGTHHWQFERQWLETLERQGRLQFTDASLASVKQCQDRFVAASDVLAEYRRKFSTQFPAHIQTQLKEHHETETQSTSSVAA